MYINGTAKACKLTRAVTLKGAKAPTVRYDARQQPLNSSAKSAPEDAEYVMFMLNTPDQLEARGSIATTSVNTTVERPSPNLKTGFEIPTTSTTSPTSIDRNAECCVDQAENSETDMVKGERRRHDMEAAWKLPDATEDTLMLLQTQTSTNRCTAECKKNKRR
jgi:hypothetical protein